MSKQKQIAGVSGSNEQLLELFVQSQECLSLEQALPAVRDVTSLVRLVALAWYLRQQDSRRALVLAQEASSLLAHADLPDSARHRLAARLLLVQGEAKWLFSELETAQKLAADALLRFGALEDWRGCSDAHFLLAWLARHRGASVICDQELQAALDCARRAGDRVREIFSEAGLASNASLRDAHAAKLCWGGYLTEALAIEFPVTTVPIFGYLQTSAALQGDFGRAAAYGMRSYQLALGTGQRRSAIHVAVNVCDAFNSMNDHETALEWVQKACDLARITGWSGSIGAALCQLAETLRRLGRLDAAKDFLEEALIHLSAFKASRNYAVALRYLSDLALDRGDFVDALACFRQLEERADILRQADLQIAARRGQAEALLQLAQAQQALAVAQAALTLADHSKDAYHRIDALRVLAAIYARHALPPPAEAGGADAALYYLQQVLDTAAGMDGYTISAEVYDAIADAYAAKDEYQNAFFAARQAAVTRDKTHNQEVTSRVIAMQVSHQTERMRVETEYHRQLADSEMRRAEILQQTTDSLELLGGIGQEITANLNSSAVFSSLDRYAHGLLHVTAFAIYLMDAEERGVYLAFGVENGVSLPHDRIPLSDPNSHAVRCIKQQSEIVVELMPDQDNPTLVPGTILTLSMLFAPLKIRDKILGVMTIQSSRPHAYGERERMIFHTLCAYGAIALDNASAYLQLERTQAQLAAQEKLAALGSLVAGVAHELNTPIGNCLLIASTVQESTADLAGKFEAQNLRRSDLGTYFANMQASSVILLRGLTSAATLISSFKQVSIDKAGEQRQFFDLRKLVQEVVAALSSRVGFIRHNISVDIAAGIELDGYPGLLQQVLTHLLDNALLHAFSSESTGHIWLDANAGVSGRVGLVVRDDGVGIQAEDQGRIFDPFFTTKLGQGGSGLGLHICYNIVTSMLGGQISVESRIGQGTRFLLDLPLVAPDAL
ncbi:MAG: GAF domain-containing protein [Burkholderiales bacterium]|nr:GAF domain-containing protein [Burkholderiales bacterium]